MRSASKARCVARASLRAGRAKQAIGRAIEALEARFLLSTVTYTVQGNSDTAGSVVVPTGPNQYSANTLRAAIISANSQSFPAVIEFNAAKFPGGAANTITLASGLTLGPTQKAAVHTYKFVGPVAKPVTISGAGAYTNFTIDPGIGAEFDNLTLVNGLGDDGGAISSDGPLTLSGDTFASNTATDQGGAVANDSGLVTVTNCVFTANLSPEGGALAVNAEETPAAVTITGSTFTSNNGTSGAGAIQDLSYVNSTLTVSNSMFMDNSAGAAGAIGDVSSDGQLTASVTGSTFTSNTAEFDDGGAIYSAVAGNDDVDDDIESHIAPAIISDVSPTSSLFLSKDTFSSNKSVPGWGGAVFSEDDTLGVSACTFAGNTAALGGGGICFNLNQPAAAVITPAFVTSGSAMLTVASSTFTNDSAIADGGGGIFTNQAISTITGTAFIGDTANYGGGLSSEGESLAALTVTNDTFSNDNATANDGGGIWSDDATFTVSSSTFTQDSSQADGGGIYSQAATLTVANTLFADDSAATGGGLYFDDPSGTASITNSTFTGDTATTPIDGTGAYGGGIYSDSSQLTVSGLTFANDSAAYGGGIFSADVTLVVGSSNFSNDSAGSGGGIEFAGGTATITNANFTGDAATNGSGGGIDVGGEPVATASVIKPNITPGFSDSAAVTLNVSNDTFSSDTAFDNGGGINFYFSAGSIDAGVVPADTTVGGDSGLLNIDQSTFTNCSADSAGGAVYDWALDSGDNLNVFNSTFNGNSSDLGGGGGIYDAVTNAQIANDTFDGNSGFGSLGGGGLYVGLGSDQSDAGNGATIVATVIDSTFDSNSAGFGLGGGISIGGTAESDVILDGDIVAGNFVIGTPATYSDLFGTFDTTSSDNIIGDGVDSNFTSGNANNNFVGTDLQPMNPMLGSLANNGGPTQTQIPAGGSAAIDNNGNWPVYDSADDDVTAVDQTGLNPRPEAKGYDIGAYQTGNTPVVKIPTVSISAPAAVHVPKTGTTTVKVPVILSAAATSAIVLTYSTIGGTATSGNGDYTGVTNATMKISAGAVAGTYYIIIANVKHETAHGAYPKTFQLKLTAATNATIIGGTEMVTITLAYP